jgi:hypothetical protein
VSRCRNRSILSHGQSVISGTVVCLSCWSAVPAATAQETESPSLMASLSVPTTTAASSRTNTSERVDYQALTVRERQPMLMSDRKPTDAEAWERFEADYSPSQKSPAPFKRQIESAKYGLDTAVFAVDRFMKNVENQTDFSLDRGSLHRTQATTSGELLGNPRVKLDLEMWRGSTPYVGVRIIIPFGR